MNTLQMTMADQLEEQLQALPLDDFVGALSKLGTGFAKGTNMNLLERAAEHGLKPGGSVIVLTIERPDGSLHRALYRYDTAAQWSKHYMSVDGTRFTETREPWDGKERVSLDNGD